MEKLESNTLYLSVWTLGMTICTSFLTGFVFGENNQAGYIFSAKFDWDSDEFLLYNTTISGIGILGVGIGSILGSVMVKNIGLRRAMILC